MPKAVITALTVGATVPVTIQIGNHPPYTVFGKVKTSKYGAPQVVLYGQMPLGEEMAQASGQITSIGYVPDEVKAQHKAEKQAKMAVATM